MELKVENESSVGDIDVSIPSVRCRWKLCGWLRSQECRLRPAEPWAGGGSHLRLALEMGLATKWGVIESHLSRKESERSMCLFL